MSDSQTTTASELPVTVTVASSGTINQENISEDTWKNRRRMAYISIISNIIFMLLAFTGILPWWFGDIDIGKYRIFIDLIQVYLVTSTSIIAAYIGFATWSYSRAGIK